jgi:uncharacterized protein
MRTLGLESLRDILTGCAFLGTGGGGSLAKGLATVTGDLGTGKLFRLADLDELPQDTWAATPYYCGSLAPSGTTAFPHRNAPFDGRECELAVTVLEGHLGTAVGATVATELGGGNTAAAFSVAARAGLPMLDADGAGRSVPDLQHSTYFVAGVPIAPMGVANKFGDTAVIRDVMDDFHAEALVRAMAVASGGHVGVADHPGRIGDLRKGLVERSIGFSEKVGGIIRSGTSNLVEALTEATQGFRLFEGTIARDCKFEDREGFTFGEIAIRGSGKDRGHRYRIWFKNENIIGWRDGKVDVTAPDLLCVIDVERREPILNPKAKRGRPVAVLGLPAPAIWRTPKGIESFGPRYFGFKTKFIPVERRHRR